jgi:hypothetical protein
MVGARGQCDDVRFVLEGVNIEGSDTIRID